EELIAAAHAGCFTMALAFQLQGAGFTPTELATEAAVSLEKEGQGFRISKSALTLRAQVPGIERDKFEELARTAEKTCPVSKVLNAEITMSSPSGSPARHTPSIVDRSQGGLALRAASHGPLGSRQCGGSRAPRARRCP